MGAMLPPAASQRFAALGRSASRRLKDQLGSLSTLRRLATVARFNNPRTRGVMSSPPTVTASATKPAGLTLGYRYSTTPNVFNFFGGQNGALFTTYHLAKSVSNPTPGTLTAVQQRVEVVVDSAQFAIQIYQWQNAGQKARIMVDGQYVDTTGISAATLNVANYIIVDFTSAGGRKPRTITVELVSQVGFDGIWVSPTETCYKPGGEILRAYIQGDSYTDGTPNSNYAWDGYAPQMCDYLGIRDFWNGGIGGTGFLQSNGINTFRQRVSDITTAGADVIFVAGGYNDSAYTQAQVTAEVALHLAAIRAAAATAETPVFYFGGWGGRFSTSSGQIGAEAGISAAIAAAGDERAFFIPTISDPAGSWFTGSGYTSATTGSGNADVYIGADAVHPTPAGHSYMAVRAADAVMRALAAF